jgi:hypothetical protein
LHKPQSKTVESDTVRTVQESTGVVETGTVETEQSDESDCMVKYVELWQTWHNLCLIYGCVD